MSENNPLTALLSNKMLYADAICQIELPQIGYIFSWVKFLMALPSIGIFNKK